jgi:hypothetical protein
MTEAFQGCDFDELRSAVNDEFVRRGSCITQSSQSDKHATSSFQFHPYSVSMLSPVPTSIVGTASHNILNEVVACTVKMDAV